MKLLNFPFIIALFTLFFAASAFAEVFNLYEQPRADSKIVGTVDSASGLVAIFTPKDSEWIKVGNPNNGNVGWVKKTDVAKAGLNFNVISGGTNGGQQYQVIQVGNTKPLTKEESEKALKETELRRLQMQKDTERLMKNVFEEMKRMWDNFPIVVPVTAPPANQPAPVPNKSQEKK